MIKIHFQTVVHFKIKFLWSNISRKTPDWSNLGLRDYSYVIIIIIII